MKYLKYGGLFGVAASLIAIALWASFWLFVGYVIFHFIARYW